MLSTEGELCVELFIPFIVFPPTTESELNCHLIANKTFNFGYSSFVCCIEWRMKLVRAEVAEFILK